MFAVFAESRSGAVRRALVLQHVWETAVKEMAPYFAQESAAKAASPVASRHSRPHSSLIFSLPCRLPRHSHISLLLQLHLRGSFSLLSIVLVSVCFALCFVAFFDCACVYVVVSIADLLVTAGSNAKISLDHNSSRFHASEPELKMARG